MSSAAAPAAPAQPRISWRLPVTKGQLTHAARTTAAALAALWIAYTLQISTPYSGAITVLIVAHPVHGLVLVKSLYRFLGTLVGGAMSLVLMAFFNQSPEMFFLIFGLWMGVCTLGSTLLRNFQSYGTVLAGYTVVLVCMPGIDTPQNIFDLVTSRVAVVSIGIACSGIVAALTTSGAAERVLHRALRATLGQMNDYVQQCLNASTDDSVVAARRKLAAAVIGLEAQIDFAVTEAAPVAMLRETLRASLVAMLGTLTTATSLRDGLRRLRETHSGASARLDAPLAECKAIIDDIATVLKLPDAELSARLEGIDDRLVSLTAAVEADLAASHLPVLVVQDRLSEMLDEVRVALAGLRALISGRIPGEIERQHARLAFHLDWRNGMINAVRATIAVWAAGAIWILTAWPYGWMMVAMIVPNAGLLAARDHPERDAVEFIKGCTMVSLLGWVVLLYLLPLGDSFTWLAMVIGPVLFLAVLLMTNPKTTFIGVGFAVFFLTLLTPTNPMVYDASLYLNSVLPTIGGAVLTMMVFRLILPTDARAHAFALARVMRRDIRALLTSRREVTPAAWESRMHDRLLRLVGRMRVSEMRHDSLMRGGFAALRIGREIIRARRLLANFSHDTAITAVMAPVRHALRLRHGHSSAATIATLRTTARRLLALADTHRPEDLPALARISASLLEVAMLMGRNRHFFHAHPLD